MELHKPDRAELRRLIDTDPEGVINLIEMLFDQIAILSQKVSKLEAKLALDSSNSSKPPSSDPPWDKPKPKSLRKRSGKRSGGQSGHKGHKLEMSKKPDEIKVLPVIKCDTCEDSLLNELVKSYKSRQIYNISIKMVVTEFQAEIKECSCGATTCASFPKGVDQPTQYGASMHSLLVYLNSYQLIPYARTVEFIKDTTGHTISQGTLHKSLKTCYKNLETFEQDARKKLINSAVVGFDETGIRYQKKSYWVHTACTDSITLLQVHPNKGFKAMTDQKILPSFKGVAVHDYAKAYYRFTQCEHALCGSHILRELVFLYEVSNCKWANRMYDLLIRMTAAADRACDSGQKAIDPRARGRFKAEYDRIVKSALRAEPRNKERIKKRGRIKQSKARNMAERLNIRKGDILRFLDNLLVPFSNNISERSFRMTKLQQKISGCFRSFLGAQMFCRIRSYIDTSKKNDKTILESLLLVMQNEYQP
jgi:transposase